MNQKSNILIKNIYYMLSYAFSVLKESEYEKIQVESFDHIDNLFAAILARGIGLQLKQGLYREYVNHTENLEVIRGRINMQETMQNRMAHKIALSCNYDELSENNLLNQILKTTVILLLKKYDVDYQYKSELKKEMLFFSAVDQIELNQIRWQDIHLQRNNRTYQLLLAICRLFIEDALMTEENGGQSFRRMKESRLMSRLYEKFILEYYIQEFSGRISGFSSRSCQIEWQVDDDNKSYLPSMQTDITLQYYDKVLIIDAKYYQKIMQRHFNALSFHSENLYQIFTYVKNKEAELTNVPHEVAGMLLYAMTDEDSFRNQTYHMSGNQISVQTLDLNQDFSMIKNQLNCIVKEYFGIVIDN